MSTRRDFLRRTGLCALAPAVPGFLSATAAAAPPDRDGRVLVVIELAGGNDALNTAVPFADPEYAKLRPRLKLPASRLVKVNDSVGLHPSLKPLDKLLDAGRLAVLPGVGYPNPSRSHFTSRAVWHTARRDVRDHSGYGWLGRALDPSAGTAYAVMPDVSKALRGRRSKAVTMTDMSDLLLDGSPPPAVTPAGGDDLLSFTQRQWADARAAAAKAAALTANAESARYPESRLAERLKLVARLMKTGMSSRVYYTTQTGYDTHAGQRFTHSSLLGRFASAVAAFFADLKAAKLDDRVTMLAFSEFGRTVKENGSAGTDHGTAGVCFVAGGVKGGVVGSVPSLTDLQQGEPKMTADFRGVYASVLQDWLGLPAKGVLTGEYAKPALFG